jgi:hypothetical protein
MDRKMAVDYAYAGCVFRRRMPLEIGKEIAGLVPGNTRLTK